MSIQQVLRRTTFVAAIAVAVTVGAAGGSPEVVAGLGTDELTDVTGHGNQFGIYNADFTQTGEFTGALKCGRSG